MNVLYTVALWLALAGGIIPSTWFLLRARPSWPPRSPALLVSGLVFVIWLLYIRSVFSLAVGGWAPIYRGPGSAVFVIAVTAVCDGLLVGLLLTFRRFRAAWRAEMDKHTKEESQ